MRKIAAKIARKLSLPPNIIDQIIEVSSATLQEMGIEISKNVSTKILKDKINTVIAQYSSYTSNTFFIKPDIPDQKISNAIKTYAQDAKKEDVLILIDDTFWGGAEDGTLLTYDTLYLHEKFQKPKSFPLSLINFIDNDGNDLYINDVKVFSGTLIDKKELEKLVKIVEEIIDAIQNTTNDTKQIEQKDDTNDIAKKLQKLQELVDLNLLTQEEYERKKNELLKNL